MLESIAQDPRRQAIPTTLQVGVRTGAHLFAVDQLQRLRERWPALAVHYAAECHPAQGCHNGYATELVSSVQAPPGTRVYLCGPPAMVEAGRSAAEAAGLPRRDMLCERFT
jgi:3-phenylpropionate/trans-cinnamate dioxygenase ferredoxin reductase subunit